MEKCRRNEEATVFVKELEIFLTKKVLENTPGVLSLGKLCDENGYSYEWINGQKPHLIKNGIRIPCNTENFVLIAIPGLSNSSSGSDSSTSRTLSRQESHCSTSSSSSSSSPPVHFHRKLTQLFFILRSVNFLMQLQFLAPVELFLKQLKGYSFWPGRNQYFLLMQFFPLCESRQKAVDAPITWSWHSEATRKHSTQESVPWQTVFALHLVSGARKLCCKELQVFQTSACGELTLWHGLIR